jgi:predicted nucleotidyltransferase component of viral defense system
MQINGLFPKTKQVFESISNLDCIKDYCLIGGTALAIQIEHRFSEDLDFCIWKKSKYHKQEIKWHVIFNELSTLGAVQKNILDLTHCDFYLDGVKITFFCNGIKEPENMQRIPVLNHIAVADPVSIGVMKLEVLQYRTTHRDYYDIYSLLQEGIALDTLIERTGRYLRHSLKTREILAMLVNRTNIRDDSRFSELLPKYNVSIDAMKQYIIEKIKALT